MKTFFDFCKERESIRVKREQLAPAPWSDDEVFQRGRFLNVFREDDRGTKALLNFVQPVADTGDLESLVQALFFARWCNRDHTLQVVNPGLLGDPAALKHALETALPSPPWCNETAYPVEIVSWEGTEYTRIDAACTLFKRIAPWLVTAIKAADGDVVKATRTIAAALGMKNDFPVFMAVMDLAWFRPDLVEPSSPVPTGIGAVAFLDLLQAHLGASTHEETAAKMIELQQQYWPTAKRGFQPIDIEYLSCECRKYYSYVNGTKEFEGKNVFTPGKSPMLPFDVPEASAATASNSAVPRATNVCVIAGGPCSGKTSLVQALGGGSTSNGSSGGTGGGGGYKVVPETAETMINAGIAAGVSVEEQRKDPVAWQLDLLERDFNLFESLFEQADLVLTDTSFVETVVFSARAGIEMSPTVDAWLANKRYKVVFFLAPIDAYESTAVRMESHDLASKISEEVQAAYRHYGYDLVVIPSMSLEARCRFVERYIKSI